MLKQIIDVLEHSEATHYQITKTTTKSHEFFFIRHDLDMNRCKEVTHYQVTVYVASEDKQYLGDASFEVMANSTKEEIKAQIDKAIYSAQFVKNLYFELLDSSEQVEIRSLENPLVVAQDFIHVMQTIEETEEMYINSYEIFVNENDKQIINSKGVNVTYSYIDSMVEAVINAKKNDTEIELYRNYRIGTCNKEMLVEELQQTMRIGVDKCIATNTQPLQDVDVVFTGSDATRLFAYYTSNTSANMKYQQISTLELDQPMTTEEIKGDTITIKGVAYLENSSCNYPYDADGTLIQDKVLIENHIPKNFWGNRRFSQYLQLENSSSLYNFVVAGGKQSKKELLQLPYLEVVEFSDFQVDSMTGEFAGEIRLAYYHTKEGIQPFSGGSIAGSMQQVQQEMWLSSEVKQYDHYVIPEVVRMKHVSITGIE